MGAPLNKYGLVTSFSFIFVNEISGFNVFFGDRMWLSLLCRRKNKIRLKLVESYLRLTCFVSLWMVLAL